MVNLMVIDKIMGDVGCEGLTVDEVLMTREDLLNTHRKLKSVGGREFAISLERGEELYDGAVLFVQDKVAVRVSLEEEDALTVCLDNPAQSARVAYNIGNMHHSAYISEGYMCMPYDGIIEDLLRSLEVKYHRKKMKLTGERANVSQHKHG